MKNSTAGEFPSNQWLGLCPFTANDRVQSLVGELRKKKNKEKTLQQNRFGMGQESALFALER